MLDISKISEIKLTSIKIIDDYKTHGSNKKFLKQLESSIRYHGLLNPLIVKEEKTLNDKHFILIDGLQRLRVWQSLNMGEEIPCIIIKEWKDYKGNDNYLNDEIVPDSEEEKQSGIKNAYASFSINLSRSKVSNDELEAIVSKLQGQGFGYASIAQRIGYTKSGVQKVIKRIKEKQEDKSIDDEKKNVIKQIKKIHTSLTNLTDRIGNHNNHELLKNAIKLIEDFEQEYIKDSNSLSKIDYR